MDKESTFELQKIDCNCNDCAFMFRDIDTYKKWEAWHREMELNVFEKSKARAIAEAHAVIEKAANDAAKKSGERMLYLANKMRFEFQKNNLLQYGKCSKFNKAVSFIPNTCQIQTQGCFKHRREPI